MLPCHVVIFNETYLLFLEIHRDAAPEVYEDDPNYDGADFLDKNETTESSKDNARGANICPLELQKATIAYYLYYKL